LAQLGNPTGFRTFKGFREPHSLSVAPASTTCGRGYSFGGDLSRIITLCGLRPRSEMERPCPRGVFV
jgi:hypothetical protein